MKNLEGFQDYYLSEISVTELTIKIKAIERKLTVSRRAEWETFLKNPDGLKFWYFEASDEDWERGMGTMGYLATDSNGTIERSIVELIC